MFSPSHAGPTCATAPTMPTAPWHPTSTISRISSSTTGRGTSSTFMNRYWVADRGANSHLWAHEYNKHGTCINTLAPACYGDSYRTGVEVVDYFVRAASLFRTLDTFTALEQAGIVPLARAALPARRRACHAGALQRRPGRAAVHRPGQRHPSRGGGTYISCRAACRLASFVPAQDLGDKGDAGNCAPRVRYPPKAARG